ncbi:hypothetical protein M8C21_004556 [Ambrosia artemisiifolia]|uniref:PWWP domain-containing protein n=1 Tax=Ambrosia artemisiifolia TaxID=4212 RepID=A0AAD5BKK5_AMBAR|nr:hypothetical protein M8C21_004556 [Ambrosia artemisiifolia]
MAPVRKRGSAKGAKGNNKLNLGDLVLAKVKGFPAWPAKISKPEDWKRTPDPRKYFVQFFGTEEIAFVAPVDIQPFTSESKDKLLTRCKGKTVKYFSQAVKEICDTFEESENTSSDSLKGGDDGQTSQPNAIFIEMVDDGMVTDGPSCATSSNDIVNHGPGLEHSSHREMGHEVVNPNVSSLANDHSSSLSKKQAEFCNDAITSPKVESISTSGAGHNTSSKIRVNIEINGKKSKKMAKAPKVNHGVVDGPNKILSPAGVGSAFQTSRIESSVNKNSKDGTQRSFSHVSKKEVTVGLENPESGDNVRKTNKILKDKTHVGLTDDLLKGVEGTGQEFLKDNVPNNQVLHPAKKSKYSEDTVKKSQLFRKNDVSSKGGNEEVKKLTPNLKTKNRSVSKGHANGSGYGSGVLGDQDVVQPTKRRRLVLDGMPEDRTTEGSITPNKGENTDSVKSGPQVHMKRRAVRILDEDEDEPKTPVHGKSSEVVKKVSDTSMSVEKLAVVTEAIQDSPDVSKSVYAKEYASKSQQDIAEVVEGKLSQTPEKAESEKKSSEEIQKVFVSPVKSPIDSHNQMVEHQPSKVNKTLGKVSGNISQKKGQSSSVRPSSGMYDGGHRYQNQNHAVNERIGTVFSGEKQNSTPKTTTKSSSRVLDSAAVLRKPIDDNLLSSERSEIQPVQTSLSGSRNADSNNGVPLVHLILCGHYIVGPRDTDFHSVSFPVPDYLIP